LKKKLSFKYLDSSNDDIKKLEERFDFAFQIEPTGELRALEGNNPAIIVK
jgi:hypothetical protein